MRWILGIAAFVLMGVSTNRGLVQDSSPPLKVAVVNVGAVFAKYHKAVETKRALESDFEPFKQKARAWTKEIEQAKDQLASGKLDADGATAAQKVIADRRKDLVQLDRDLKEWLGKRQEEGLVAIWKDIRTAVEKYAQSKGFGVVLGYADPAEIGDFDNRSIIRRRDGRGGLTPLNVHPSLDITQDVIAFLNEAYRKKPK